MATAQQAGQTEEETRNLEAVKGVLQYWNAHDIPGILKFYDEQITWYNVALEEVYRGHAEVGAFLGKLMHAYPDLTFDVVEKFAAHDRISERWFIRGTHLGEFMSVPATGRSVEIPGISMVRMRDGRFLEDRFVIEMGTVMRQMGLMPPLSITKTPVGKAALWVAVNPVRVAAAAAGMIGGFLALRWLSKPFRGGR